ncbi:MAG: Multisubunit Na+/H+ antiporter MnhE subunit [Candidatus Methanohalarchaeum thermophilum]|uniref:Multisubunit Na+/H+ antiporter MnhE subunit n=1 Tax=Methanohalarchaeum thermophilum TaxID=1903181 RepID=A0A1Q6DUP9_METT1|nr:MAG: Multisubunit Na+/H+ antiporter MnhE subunit [Candidatus Methanohalarchaeum thermophilum]
MTERGILDKRFLFSFLVFLGFWCVLSNVFDIVHLGIGFVFSLVLAYITSPFLIKRESSFASLPREAIRFLWYFWWLLINIVKANIDVAKIVLSPSIRISPRIISYESDLDNDIEKTLFGNSITLTPGTLTVNIEEDIFFVHCLAERHGEEIKKGEMEKRIIDIDIGEEN